MEEKKLVMEDYPLFKRVKEDEDVNIYIKNQNEAMKAMT